MKGIKYVARRHALSVSGRCLQFLHCYIITITRISVRLPKLAAGHYTGEEGRHKDVDLLRIHKLGHVPRSFWDCILMEDMYTMACAPRSSKQAAGILRNTLKLRMSICYICHAVLRVPGRTMLVQDLQDPGRVERPHYL